MESSINLPTDINCVPIDVGDKLIINGLKGVHEVWSLEYVGDDVWLANIDNGDSIAGNMLKKSEHANVDSFEEIGQDIIVAWENGSDGALESAIHALRRKLKTEGIEV